VDAARLQRRGVERRPERLRGGEHPLDIHVEPPVHGLTDDVAADEEDEHRRRHGHQEEDEQELDAQPRAEDPAPPLHEHADEVPPEDEDQDEEERDVEDGEAEEQHRGGEIRLEVAALAQDQLCQEEDDEESAGDGEDQPGVVLKALPRHRDKCSSPATPWETPRAATR
jgi:hypothetical protein